MSERQTEQSSAQVLVRAKQAEEIYGRWPWVERRVWSERMLQSLENGVKGSKWFSLIDKVWKMDNLAGAWLKSLQNGGSAGVDGQTVHAFTANLDRELEELQAQLKAGTYQPKPVKRGWMPKPGSKEKRPLGIPAVRDRIVQGAARNVIEPIFERQFAEHSYGFRPGRGCKDALRRADCLLQQGYTWVVEVDFKSYFDTIPHQGLMERVREQISDGRLLELIERYLKAGVMDGMRGWEPTERGTPQGAVISPLLANLYLNPLDHLMADAGHAMTRYADDLIVQCRSQKQAKEVWEQIRQWSQANGLTLHPEKTRIVDATQKGGFDFLGYHFERGMKWPRKKSMDKLKDTIRNHTRRTAGQSLSEIIAGINRALRGWFEYFKHSKSNVFPTLDGWVRMRLRSLLRKRLGKRGRGRGNDQIVWPNAHFERHGYWSLVQAHGRLCNHTT